MRTLKISPKNPPLELINEFSKVARYKTNIQKSVAFLCTSNALAESKTKKRIPFTVT